LTFADENSCHSKGIYTIALKALEALEALKALKAL
jgi:hypothetical protein